MSMVRILVAYDGEWIESPEGGVFRFNGSKSKGISVPKKITYLELLDRVYCLLMVDRNEFDIIMKFLYASSLPVAPADIVNDDDVNFFIGENSGNVSLRTPLCLTLVRRSSHVQQTAYGEGSSQTVNALPEPQERTFEPYVPFTGVEQNVQGFCVNSDREVKDFGTSSAELAPGDVSVEPHLGTQHSQSTDNPTLVDPTTPAAPTRFCQASDDPVEWVTTKEALSALTKEACTASAMNHSEKLEVGTLLSCKKELQEKLTILAIRQNFEFRVEKSSKDFLVVTCVDEDCGWRLRATKVPDSTSFEIRKFVKDHSCLTRTRNCEHHRQASSSFVGQYIKSKYQGTNRTYKPREIIEDMRRELGVNLKYEQAWRAREIALKSEGRPHMQRPTGRPVGRPRKEKTSSVAKEGRPTRRCGKCGKHGHNRQTCSNPTGTSGVTTQDKVPNDLGGNNWSHLQ